MSRAPICPVISTGWWRRELRWLTILLLAGSGGMAAAGDIILQSTTSTVNSGLYDRLLHAFEEVSGISVSVVSAGTGQAIRNAANCDGDVLLVHAKPAEERFVADGGGVERFDVMYNDFVIVGPQHDPAGIAGLGDAGTALKRIAEAEAVFTSRGDDSGTHRKELELWAMAGIDPEPASGLWYRETGSGMGATLNAGIGMGGYVMTDRATWITFGNAQDHRIHVEGDLALFNQYGVMLINPARCENVRAEKGQALVDWLISEEGQEAIASHRKDGQQLFFPNARKAR